MFNGKIHYKWPFSIAMLVHQRVSETWIRFLFYVLQIQRSWMKSTCNMYIQNNKIVLECIRLLNVDLVKSDPQLPSQTPLPFQEFDPCSWSTGSSDPVIISPTSPCHDTSRSCGEDWPHLWITETGYGGVPFRWIVHKNKPSIQLWLWKPP